MLMKNLDYILLHLLFSSGYLTKYCQVAGLMPSSTTHFLLQFVCPWERRWLITTKTLDITPVVQLVSFKIGSIGILEFSKWGWTVVDVASQLMIPSRPMGHPNNHWSIFVYEGRNNYHLVYIEPPPVLLSTSPNDKMKLQLWVTP